MSLGANGLVVNGTAAIPSPRVSATDGKPDGFIDLGNDGGGGGGEGGGSNATQNGGAAHGGGDSIVFSGGANKVAWGRGMLILIGAVMAMWLY